MARQKQPNPMRRIASGELMESLSKGTIDSRRNGNSRTSGVKQSDEHTARPQARTARSRASHAGRFQLAVCVAGIYATFLSWALLQERITKTPYNSHPPIHVRPIPPVEYFQYPIFLNTIQSFFASIVGAAYLLFNSPKIRISPARAIPSKSVFLPLLLVSVTSSLASPFGYASLAHVDYLTFVLAKSCKLLPVMFLHITLFQRRYPLYKYLVIFAVTAGVALFTLSHPVSPSQSGKGARQSSLYGLALLGINLLFDGLTNTVQDHIFKSPERYGTFTGPQMMLAQNMISTGMTILYLLITPLIPFAMLPWMAGQSANELNLALSFLRRHPSVLYDVLGFAACGAVGQVFIFVTLERFSSLLLVTVTVTRKMLTMLLSVVWFGKRLTPGQWAGVGLVFAGVGGEGVVESKKKKALDTKRQKKN